MNRDLGPWARRGLTVACALGCLAAGGCGSGGPGGDVPEPDPDRDGCIPYDYYAEGAVPVRTVAGWTGGLVTAVDAEDGLAVLASAYGGLRVLDVSDPAAPRLLGAAPCLAAFDVDLQGSLAAVAGGNDGFALFDLSDPALPQLLVRIVVSGGESTSFTDAVLLDGSRLFVSGFHRQLVSYDISDPRRPRERGRQVLDRPGALAVDGKRLFAGARAVFTVGADGRLTHDQDLGQGAAEDLVVSGPLLHAAVEGGLATFDLSEPDTVVLADLRTLSRARCLAAAGPLVFVGTSPPGARLMVFEFAGGEAPLLRTDAPATGYVAFYGLAHVDGVLLAGDRWLRTIDVGDPAHPVFAPAPREPAIPQGLAVSGDHAVVVDAAQASVYALGEVAADRPAEVHDVGESILHLAAGRGRVYLVRNANGLLVLDPAAGGAPPVLRHPGVRFGMLAVGDSLLVTGYGGTLRVYDLTDPDAPRFTGALDFADYVRQVAVAGDRVLVSLAAAQLVLVDVSDPAQPVEIARDIAGLQVQDSAAVAWADGFGLDYHVDGTLRVVRPDAEGRLQTVFALASEGEARGLELRGPVAYALSGLPWGGASHLTVLDLTDPARISVIGRADQPDAVVTHLDLAGDYAYALTAGGVLRYWLDCRSLD